MKAKVIETGEIVDVTPYPTWYKEKGQGPDRRAWAEDELEFIYSNKKEERLNLEKELGKYLDANDIEFSHQIKLLDFAKHFFELGLKLAQKGE